MMTNSAVVKNPDTSEQGPELAGFTAACVIAALLATVFVVFSLASGTETDLALDSKINPNTAPAPLLMQLPKIGPEKALAIIEYRRQTKRQPAFENIEDLQKVKGIGPKTAKQLQKWLIF